MEIKRKCYSYKCRYHPKFECFYGELAQIASQPGKISMDAEYEWILGVNSVTNSSRIQVISYGNAHLHKMYGHWWVAESRKCRNNFFHLFRQLHDKLSQWELEQWVATAWSIWNARNKFYFEYVQLQSKIVIEVVSGLLEEYQRLMALQWQATFFCCICNLF